VLHKVAAALRPKKEADLVQSYLQACAP
jgi:hypothetical protein